MYFAVIHYIAQESAESRPRKKRKNANPGCLADDTFVIAFKEFRRLAPEF
jgi:hypothetical protein